MKSIDYQKPKLLIVRLEEEDVVTMSGVPSDEETFDKGVEDFFGNQ